MDTSSFSDSPVPTHEVIEESLSEFSEPDVPTLKSGHTDAVVQVSVANSDEVKEIWTVKSRNKFKIPVMSGKRFVILT